MAKESKQEPQIITSDKRRIARRKSLKRKAACRSGSSAKEFRWVDGVLHRETQRGLERVPDVPEVKKPERPPREESTYSYRSGGRW